MSSISPSWTALALLTGLGAGYLLALLISSRQRWSETELMRTLTSLSNEVVALREAVQNVRGVDHETRSVRGADHETRSVRSVRTANTSEFMSACSESGADSDDEFFDPASAPAAPTMSEEEAQLDERGRATQGSEEVCISLVQEIQQRLEEDSHNVGLLWRLARVLTHQSMHNQHNPDTEKELLEQAASRAKEGLALDEDCWQAHQWYATATGSMSKFQGTQQKIEQGFEYKEHIDRAISLNPVNPTLHYLSGRWCYEVAGLSWFERKAASALFANPPEATYDETLQAFMRAEELNPGVWKGNTLMIAKCHIKLNDMDSAIEWLHKAHTLHTLTPDDVSSQTEIEELLTQHDPYFVI